MAPRWMGLLACICASLAHAQTNIELLDQQYTTDLSIKAYSWKPATGKSFVSTEATQIRRSESPLTSALQGSPRVFAQAQANTFSVGTNTSAYGDYANNETGAYARADAESLLSFRVLQDTTTPLQFSINASGMSFFSDGFFSLYDRTAGAYVFAYSWQSHEAMYRKYAPPPGATPVVWEGFYRSNILLNPLLLSSHLYDLTLHASTDANTDSQYVNLGVSGLYPVAAPVPEPEAFVMALVGLAAVGFSALGGKTRRS